MDKQRFTPTPMQRVLRYSTAQCQKSIGRVVLPISLVLGCAIASAETTNSVIAAGEAKSAVCRSCHGTEGITTNPAWPNLAGQNKRYLENQLKRFRDGGREDPVMSAMAAPLSDEDIANLSAYYSNLAQ